MARNCLRRYYHIGEKRIIEWNVRPNNQLDTLVITEAIYEIWSGKQKIQTGKLEVEGQRVRFVYQPLEVGEFLIKIFVTVPPETLGTELVVSVEE